MYRDVDKGMVYLVFYFRIHVTNNKSVLVNQRDYFIIGLFSEFENKWAFVPHESRELSYTYALHTSKIYSALKL